jgi:NADH-quinone oxidoreductase subunit N
MNLSTAILLLPDALLLLAPFVVLFVDLFFNPRHEARPVLRALSWVLLAVGGALAAALCCGEREVVFLHAYRVTPWMLWFKVCFTGAALVAARMAEGCFAVADGHPARLTRPGEFFTLLAFAAGGMSVTVSALDLITLFIGLEMATIPLYVLSGFYRRHLDSAEGAMKFIIMGSLATAFVLFGYSLLYGATGHLQFSAIAAYLAEHPGDPLVRAAALFIFTAGAFKLALAPFHMWAPDVYQGAPLPVAAFLSTASKAAAAGFLVVLFYGPLAPVRPALAPVFAAFAAATMLVGNLGSLRQTNFRRFMAYSSIAQAGYLLLGFLAEREYAVGALLYFLVVYLTANLAVFFVYATVRGEDVAAVNGLSRTNPALAAVLMLAFFSLAGIPPLAGFNGKFWLFAAAAGAGRYWLVLFAVLNSVVALYYYMNVIRAAYIEPPAADARPVKLPRADALLLFVLVALLLVLALWPAFNRAVFAAAL